MARAVARLITVDVDVGVDSLEKPSYGDALHGSATTGTEAFAGRSSVT
jgi:hypothetical protein